MDPNQIDNVEIVSIKKQVESKLKKKVFDTKDVSVFKEIQRKKQNWYSSFLPVFEYLG